MTFDEADECEDRHIAGASDVGAPTETGFAHNSEVATPSSSKSHAVRHSASGDFDEVERLIASGVNKKRAFQSIAIRTGRQQKNVAQNYSRALAKTPKTHDTDRGTSNDAADSADTSSSCSGVASSDIVAANGLDEDQDELEVR